MIEVLGADYVTAPPAPTASPPWRVVGWLALKNAMLPTLAMIGLRFGWTLGSTVLVETVFDWPGIGLYAVSSATIGLQAGDGRRRWSSASPSCSPTCRRPRSMAGSIRGSERHRSATRIDAAPRCRPLLRDPSAALGAGAGRAVPAALRHRPLDRALPRRRHRRHAPARSACKPPSAAHWFGTDEMGDDIFTRVIIGTRTSLWVGLTITGIAIADRRAARHRRRLSRRAPAQPHHAHPPMCSWQCPAWCWHSPSSPPSGPASLHGVLALSLVWWPGYVRLIEAKALTLRGEPYVEAARTMGAGHACDPAAPHPPNCISPLGGEGEHGHGLGHPRRRLARLHRPRRQAAGAGMGRDDLGRAQLHAGLVVVLALPRPVHLSHRARLQPVRRRPARHGSIRASKAEPCVLSGLALPLPRYHATNRAIPSASGVEGANPVSSEIARTSARVSITSAAGAGASTITARRPNPCSKSETRSATASLRLLPMFITRIGGTPAGGRSRQPRKPATMSSIYVKSRRSRPPSINGGWAALPVIASAKLK